MQCEGKSLEQISGKLLHLLQQLSFHTFSTCLFVSPRSKYCTPAQGPDMQMAICKRTCNCPQLSVAPEEARPAARCSRVGRTQREQLLQVSEGHGGWLIAALRIQCFAFRQRLALRTYVVLFRLFPSACIRTPISM
jgi:hypothetical protein